MPPPAGGASSSCAGGTCTSGNRLRGGLVEVRVVVGPAVGAVGRLGMGVRRVVVAVAVVGAAPVLKYSPKKGEDTNASVGSGKSSQLPSLAGSMKACQTGAA